MTKTRRFIATSAFTISLLVTSAAFAGNGVGCLGIAAASAQKGPAFDTTYSATSTLDVDLNVIFNNGLAQKLADDHTVQVRIFTPRGFLYQEVDVPFTSTKMNGRSKKLAGYPYPVPVQTLKPVDFGGGKNLAAVVRLPVAGTAIMTSSLYGQWRAEAFVDGETLRCSSPFYFTITP